MRIVAAIDLNSDSLENTLEQSVRFAKQLGAVLDLAFVDGLPYVDGLIHDPSVSAALAREAQILREANERRLQAQVDALPETIRGQAITRYGFAPAQAVCELSADHDLLLIATHGRTGLRHLMLGSVAEKIIRLASVPTLVLRLPSS